MKRIMSVINIQTTHEIYQTAKVSDEDSGFDLYCVRDEIVESGTYSNKIKLGVSVALINDGKRKPFKLYPRSSTGSKTPLRLSNSVGIIDSGYNGELCALVDNTSDKPFKIEKGSRLFQIVQFSGEPFSSVKFVQSLPSSNRSTGGFGSTGK